MKLYGTYWLLSAVLLLTPSMPVETRATQQPANPPDPAVQQSLGEGRAALAAQHYEDALKAFRKANKAARDACFLCWMGMAESQKKLGDLDGALKSAEKCLATAADDGQRAEAHALRGDLDLSPQLDKKKLKAAETEYRAAAELDPRKPHYHLKIAVALFKQSRDDEGIVEARRYLELEPNGQFAVEAQKFIANPNRARGLPAPQFRFTTLQGETLTLETLAGKVVVLDFWATWCVPCRESVGELRELVKKYPQDKFVLISVSGDKDEQKWRQFIGEKKMTWRQCWDKGGQIGDLFGIRAIPTYLVIDGDGMIRERIQGLDPRDSVVHRLKETLPSIFAAKIEN